MTRDDVGRDLGVVVGIDGSPRGESALRFAATEARRLSEPLTLVHVLPDYVPMTPMLPMMPDELQEVGHRLLDGAVGDARRTAPDVEAASLLLHGRAVHELVGASQDARLLVVGRESSPGWARVFTGAVTMGVAARSHCPVVCVPDEWRPVEPGDGRVVVGFEGPQDVELLAHAFASAETLGARLTVLHAWELPGYYDDIIVRRTHDADWNADARDRVEAYLTELRAAHPAVDADVRVVHEQPGQALREASRTADLLMLGRRGEGPALFHLGGTARALLREAACPVLVVPVVRVHGAEARPSGVREEATAAR